ncbi:MAG: hypothetical protein HWD61_09020 [Parachlamydiaceae bacterium]|nr:MAG: hypothetical protein HWD61_09020 [Parachlamydiaceae bacterium]
MTLFGFYLDEEEAGTFGQKEINDKVRITFINGLLNARYYFLETVEMLSNLHGGITSIMYLDPQKDGPGMFQRLFSEMRMGFSSG